MKEHERIKIYFDGVREGLWKYAHWQDGVQYVGTMGTTLKEAVAKVDKEESERLACAMD